MFVLIVLLFYLDIRVPAYILYCNVQMLFCPHYQVKVYIPVKVFFPSPGAKDIIFSTFSVISGSCNRVSVRPEVLSSTSHHPSSPLQSGTNCSA